MAFLDHSPSVPSLSSSWTQNDTTNNMEHLFICLFAIHIAFLATCLFRSFVYFLIWVICFCTFYFVPLICVSVPSPVSRCHLHCCSIIVNPKIRYYDSSNCVFFFKIILAVLVLLPFCAHFRTSLFVYLQSILLGLWFQELCSSTWKELDIISSLQFHV